MTRNEMNNYAITPSLEKILYCIKDAASKNGGCINFDIQLNYDHLMTDEICQQLKDLGYTCEKIGNQFYISWQTNDKIFNEVKETYLKSTQPTEPIDTVESIIEIEE